MEELPFTFHPEELLGILSPLLPHVRGEDLEELHVEMGADLAALRRPSFVVEPRGRPPAPVWLRGVERALDTHVEEEQPGLGPSTSSTSGAVTA